MDNIFSRLLPARLTGVDKAVVGKAPDRKNKTGIEVKAAMFFDGTGNNRNNVAQRHMNQQHLEEEDGIRRTESFPKYGLKKDGSLTNTSYAAGYSNVSILERMNRLRKAQQREISIYVEGIGTTDDKDDDMKGSGFGTGPTGIKSKVKSGVMLLGEGIAKILEPQKDVYVEKIIVDVFGFSRGAAAARHFVAQLKSEPDLAAQLATPQATIEIKFVGLFDTVSSYGVGLGFGSNVAELGLDLGSVPKKVVHLTASNEYRKNFSLTDITSSLGVGYELTLPGVHSNIGGSYGEQEDEVRALHVWERDTLIAQGWYKEEEAPLQEEPVYDPQTGLQIGVHQWVVGTRRDLNQEYQFIPLRIMADNAKQHEMLLEDFVEDFSKYSLPSTHVLAPVQNLILAQVGQHGASGRHALLLADEVAQVPPDAQTTTLSLEPELVHKLRNRYLRRSASIGIQGLADGKDRIGMGERRDHQQPHRLIFPG